MEPAEAALAHDVLVEVATWLEERGMKLWDESELDQQDMQVRAAQRELVVGFENGRAVACLFLQSEDELYWPTASRGEALYVHRLAVRRAWAGSGWSRRLLDWAAEETRRRGRALLRLDTELRPKLMAFYESTGFVRFDEAPFVVGPHAVVRYEKRV